MRRDYSYHKMALEIGFPLPVSCCTLSLSVYQNTTVATTDETTGNRKQTDTHTHTHTHTLQEKIPNNLLVGNKTF